MTFQINIHNKTISFDQGQLEANLHQVCRQKDKCDEVKWILSRSQQLQSSRLDTESVQQIVLNQLKVQILKTDDKNLIHLFIRAVKNHDALYPEKTVDPVVIYEKHLKDPDFKISKSDITLDVQTHVVFITTKLKIEMQVTQNQLVLDGKGHEVITVHIDKKQLAPYQYVVTENELIIDNIPCKKFEIEIYSSINPFENHSMEGMYCSGKFLTTQCESEGARRIFFTSDRPDVLSCYTTTIIADKKQYPHRLSNGNFKSEEVLDNGRTKIVWEDPFPKPSYLFAAVLGDLSVLQDTFTTKKGHQIQLEVYVEKGLESRAKYSLYALKKSMEFDEKFFDRVYDLNSLKMVAIPDFNSGAMENKGLMIFNDTCLLVDAESGTDEDFMGVAHTIMHEYAHNWSGNRVTVKNWFQLALKEAFTDFRSTLFMNWLFSEEWQRVSEIRTLRERQFPEDSLPTAHPIQVESYVNAGTLYDNTTYVKGRELFGVLRTILDEVKFDGFRKSQNLYFDRYDHKAVTLKELIKSAETYCKTDLSQFERWFTHVGTPEVNVKLSYNEKRKFVTLEFMQNYYSPIDKKKQSPLHIPIPVELLGPNGESYVKKKLYHMKDQRMLLTFENIPEYPTPLFLHGLSAPVKYNYSFSDSDLRNIILHADDHFWRWEAGQLLLRGHIVDLCQQKEVKGDLSYRIDPVVIQTYKEALLSNKLTALEKSMLLELPSVRSIADQMKEYHYKDIADQRRVFMKKLSEELSAVFVEVLERYPEPKLNNPESENFSENIKIRALRNICLNYLFVADEERKFDVTVHGYNLEKLFNNKIEILKMIANSKNQKKMSVIRNFYDQWKDDKAILNTWISIQVEADSCTVATLDDIQSCEGYDKNNPNHIRSLFRGFVKNLGAYHDSEGVGYRYVTDKVIEVSKTNPHLAMNYIAHDAYLDYQKLPTKQRDLMRKELERLMGDASLDSSIRHYAASLLGV